MAKRDEWHLGGEGVKRYDRLRKYLGLIYLYGCFDPETLAKVNDRSIKDYNVVIQLILDLFWPDADTLKERRRIKRNPQILRQYAQSAQNRMTDSYMMFSMDKISLLLTYMILLQRLGRGEATIRQLADALEQMQDSYCDFFDGSNLGDAYQNARNHAQELVQHGHVSWDKNELVFRLQEDAWEGLSHEQVQQLHRYVCFAASVTYPRVAGSFLQRSLERELLRRGLTPYAGSEFILRHNSSFNIFDEEVVYCLLDMIENRQSLQIGEEVYIPAKLRVDCRLGRWYVLLASEQNGVFVPSIRAVSRLERPAVHGSVSPEQWAQAHGAVEQAYGRCLFSGQGSEKPVTVEVLLKFGQERGRAEQFARELRMGSIETTDRGDIYRAVVNDPGELVPLLRAYAPWLQVLPGDHDLPRRLAQSLGQMQKNLDGVCWQEHPVNNRTFEKQSANTGSGQDTARRLLSPFQSRLVQFALDRLACAQEDAGKLRLFEQERARRYGIREPERVTAQLRDAGFLEDSLRLPMSKAEREYLQFILDPAYMPEAELFLSKETREHLAKKLAAHGEKLSAWRAHIQWMKAPGMGLPQDPGPEDFRKLLQAVRERKLIAYRYRTRGEEGEKDGQCLPWKVEYSAYDRRWWVILYDIREKRTIKALLNHLREIRVLEESTVTDGEITAAMDALRMDENVVLRIRDEQNALRRCFTAFENQEICASSYSPETGYTLQFRAFRFDEEEILRQLMYLGHNVSLEGPESLREALRLRLEKARDNFSEEILFSTET